MKIVAVLEADLDVAPPGRRSRLAEPLCGVPVLRRTVQRFAAAECVEKVLLTVPEEQAQRVRELCAGLPVAVEARQFPRAGYAPHVWSARKWCPGGWRGGLGDTTIFDEFMSPAELTRICQTRRADAVATLPASAALIDPSLIDQVVSHHEKHFAGFRLTFTQAPPGMAVSVWQPVLLAELAKAGQWPGSVLGYTPKRPIIDMTAQDCHCSIDPAIARCGVRLLADSRRSFDLCERVLAHGEGLSATEICRHATREAADPGEMPEEIEIELTTDDELPDGLHPRKPSVKQRGPMNPGMFERLIEEIAAWDDARITLGGFGEPTMHPDFGRILASCREKGVFGLHVRTNGLGITNDVADAIVGENVDVVSFHIDAEGPDRYREVHGFDGHDRVLRSWETLVQRRREAGVPRPAITAVLTKAKQTLDALDAFYDGWMQRCGSAQIVGYSDRAAQRPDHAVVDMQPPARCPCRRIRQRVTVLADGTVTFCEEDFNGLHPAGHLRDASLREIWQGERFDRLRSAHEAEDYGVNPLCSACKEWHRP